MGFAKKVEKLWVFIRFLRIGGSCWRVLESKLEVMRHLVGILEALGGSWRHLGGSWRHLGGSWRHLGSSWRHLRGILGGLGTKTFLTAAGTSRGRRQGWGPTWGILRPTWAVWEAKMGVWASTWKHLGTNLGGFGTNFAVMEPA